MNPLFRIDFSISDSLKIVRKSVLIYETIIVILTDANGNKNRNVLNLTAPAAFQVNTIYVNIGIVPGKRTGTSGFDMFICLFIQIADDSGGYFRSI